MRTAHLVLLAGVAGLCSCIRFDRQEMTFRYDADRGELRVFQHYQRIYGNRGEELTETEIRELDSVINGERTFFFANWIFEYDREGVKRALAETEQPAEEGEEPPSAEEQAALARRDDVLRLLLANVSVRNGPFFLDEDGALCGYQEVTVRNAPGIVDAANRMLDAAVLAAPSLKGFSQASADRMRTAARGGFGWLSLDGGAVIGRMPVTHGDFLLGKQQAAAKIREALARDPLDRDTLENAMAGMLRLMENDLWVSYAPREEHLEVTVGYPTNRSTRIRMDLSDGYRSNAVARVRETCGLATNVSVEAARRAFLFGVDPPAAP
jgi:hypothetical protein